MNDISNAIKDAISKDVMWSVSDFFIVIKLIEENGYSVSFWENEENWAQIISLDGTVGYMWKKYPLVFIENHHAKNIKLILHYYNFITFIDIQSLSNSILKISDTSLFSLFDEGLNFDCFSPEDLWLFTNSV